MLLRIFDTQFTQSLSYLSQPNLLPQRTKKISSHHTHNFGGCTSYSRANTTLSWKYFLQIMNVRIQIIKPNALYNVVILVVGPILSILLSALNWWKFLIYSLQKELEIANAVYLKGARWDDALDWCEQLKIKEGKLAKVKFVLRNMWHLQNISWCQYNENCVPLVVS